MNQNFIEVNKEDICASIQHSIITILMEKVNEAIDKTGIKEVAIAGGVSANSGLREAIKLLEKKGCKTYIPPFRYCTDNAAMIAITPDTINTWKMSFVTKALPLKHVYIFNYQLFQILFVCY